MVAVLTELLSLSLYFHVCDVCKCSCSNSCICGSNRGCKQQKKTAKEYSNSVIRVKQPLKMC